MSGSQGTAPRVDQTAEKFTDVLTDITTRDETSAFPQECRYTIVAQGANDSVRVTLHKPAFEDSNLTPGDELSQYYFEDYGMLVLDFNARQ